MHTTKRPSFQGQIETVLRMSLSDLDLRIKKLSETHAEDHGRKPVGESVPAEGWKF